MNACGKTGKLEKMDRDAVCFWHAIKEGRELCRPVICVSVHRVIRDEEPALSLSLPGAAK